MRILNYIEAISIFYPETEISTTGVDYDSIIWGASPIIPRAVLDQKIIDYTREHKSEELSSSCQQAIISGFESNALGTARMYDSDEVDQLNLIGAVANTSPTATASELAGYTIYYASRDVTTGEKSYNLHSYTQIRQVLSDGANVKLTHLQKFFMLKMQVYSTTINNLADLSQLELIVW